MLTSQNPGNTWAAVKKAAVKMWL